jgi:hypothetical protein
MRTVPNALAAGVLGVVLAGGSYVAATQPPHYAKLTPDCAKISDAMHTIYSNTDIAADMLGLLPALTDIANQMPAEDPVAAAIHKMNADRADPAAVILDRAAMVAACSEEAQHG